MAAGDVVITRDLTVDSPRGSSRGRARIVYGTVTLDGGNATPVDLSAYVTAIDAAVVSMEGTAAPGADPSAVTSAISGTTLNVYAWKITGAADATLIASTDNARLVNFFAVGPSI